MSEELKIEDLENITIDQQVCGHFGNGFNKTLEFRWASEFGVDWVVRDHKTVVGTYEDLQKAVGHYNRLEALKP